MSVTEALRAAARYIEEHGAGADPGADPEGGRLTAILALGHELDSLAAAGETATVYPREYEVVREGLRKIGFELHPEIARRVDDAFRAASPPRAAPVRAPAGRWARRGRSSPPEAS